MRLGTILGLVGLLSNALYAVLATRLALRQHGKPSPYGKSVLLAGRLVLGRTVGGSGAPSAKKAR
jgi:hypothetical protein